MKENRLVYEDKVPGAPAATPGQDPSFLQVQQSLAAMASSLPAMTEKARDLFALAAKPRQDREQFKQELEGKAEEKEKLFTEISKGLEGKVFSLPAKDDKNFDSKLKESVKGEVLLLAALSDDNFWKITTVDEVVGLVGSKEMLADIFTEEAMRQVSGDLTGKKSFTIKYFDRKIVIELSERGLSAAKTEPAKVLSEAEVEISKEGPLRAVLGFLGLIQKNDKGEENLAATAGDWKVKIIGWLFGAEFAKKMINPIVGGISARRPDIGEKITGLPALAQSLIAPFLPPVSRKEISGLLGDLSAHVTSWKSQNGLEEDFVTTKGESVIGGDLIINIPAGKTVNLKQQGSLTVDFVKGGSKTYDGGAVIEGGPDMEIKLSTGSRIPAGATFDKGVRVWFEEKKGDAAEVAEKEEPVAVASDEATRGEAPTETPAA